MARFEEQHWFFSVASSNWHLKFIYSISFDTWSHYLAQADFEIKILLSQPPEFWDYRGVAIMTGSSWLWRVIDNLRSGVVLSCNSYVALLRMHSLAAFSWEDTFGGTLVGLWEWYTGSLRKMTKWSLSSHRLERGDIIHFFLLHDPKGKSDISKSQACCVR